MAATTGTAAQWELLRTGRDRYASEISPHYDEVLWEVSSAISRRGSAGKADIGALLFWKRLRGDTRWVSELHALPDSIVRHHTARAVSYARDPRLETSSAAGSARGALDSLPGLRSGDALASALLTAAAPHRMAVFDRRAQAGLLTLGITLPRQRRYRTYIRAIVELLALAPTDCRDWSPRDVDLTLYMLGRPETATVR